MRNLFYFLLVNAVLFTACEGEDEQLPAYLYLEDIRVSTTADEGTARDKVTNAQVYVGGEYIGVVNVPGRVPVLQEGPTEIVIDPLVRDNGSSATLALYPFYERMTLNVDLRPLQTDTLRPVTTYAGDRTEFLFVESFDSPGTVLVDDRDGNAGTALELTDEGALEGLSARFVVDTDNPRLEIATDPTQPFDLRSRIAGTYLEMDFKSEILFQVGLVGLSANLPPTAAYSYILAPKDEWTKIYLNLTSEVRASDFDGYQIGILANLPEDGTTSGTVYIDNLKLVTYR